LVEKGIMGQLNYHLVLWRKPHSRQRVWTSQGEREGSYRKFPSSESGKIWTSGQPLTPFEDEEFSFNQNPFKHLQS
jgi:hypothetical protein